MMAYSREINAAFEQVTPLVVAGFKVLRTTKNISILLAVIQVLTVVFLGIIALILIAILYSVNPDLENERRQLVTPFFRWLASISLWSFCKSLAGATLALGTVVVVGWLILEEERVEGEDADQDASELVDEETEKAKKKNTKKNKKAKQDKTTKDEEKDEGKEVEKK